MRRTGLLLALIVAGCGGGSGYQTGVPHGGGRGLPTVALQGSQAVVVPPGREGRRALALRAFVAATPGDPVTPGWTEVTGAVCRVTGGDYFAATVPAPVRLTLPDLGPDAPALRADCTMGTLAGTDTVSPVFSWPAEGRPQPATRAWWGGGWWWGFQRTGPLSYPDLAVGLH